MRKRLAAHLARMSPSGVLPSRSNSRDRSSQSRTGSAAPQLRAVLSILAPHAQKVGGALGENVALGSFAFALEQPRSVVAISDRLSSASAEGSSVNPGTTCAKGWRRTWRECRPREFCLRARTAEIGRRNLGQAQQRLS